MAGGILGVLATTLPWATVSGGGFAVALSGSEVTGGLGQALALALIAGAVAQFLLRRGAKIAMAVVLALLGVFMVVLALAGRNVDPGMARAELRAVSLAEPVVTGHLLGPLLYACAGVVAVAGAFLGARAVTAATRFDRSPQRQRSTWERLDDGTDPTVDDVDTGGINAGEPTQWGSTDREDDS